MIKCRVAAKLVVWGNGIDEEMSRFDGRNFSYLPCRLGKLDRLFFSEWECCQCLKSEVATRQNASRYTCMILPSTNHEIGDSIYGQE